MYVLFRLEATLTLVVAKVDQKALERVRKALALASHEGTGEAEAKAALRMASSYMRTHNIEQADIMAAETDEQKFKRYLSILRDTSLLTNLGLASHRLRSNPLVEEL